jgi:F0F1-type ATP synthase assembly protein I
MTQENSAPAPSQPHWLLRPDPALSWKFISLCYLFLACVSGLFAALQFVGKVSQVTGFWIVPFPSCVALPYALLLWRQQSRLESATRPPASGESKKDS